MNNIKHQLWKISLSMASIYGHDMDFEVVETYKGFWNLVNTSCIDFTEDILYGVPQTNSKLVSISNIDKAKGFLAKVFNINSPQDMKVRLDGLSKGSSVRKIFDAKRKIYLALPFKERTSLADPKKQGGSDAHQYQIIDNYESLLPQAGVLAYDIANYISICRLGAFLGYIKPDEMMELINEPAALAQRSYKSFEEFGYASTAGILIYTGKIEYDEYRNYFERLNKLLTHKDSHWRNLDWNMSLL